jgi:subtilisin-like proprotein convertase family protein
LAAVHSDPNADYANWTFSSVRHWGESATGNWTLKIADRSTSGNSTGGTLTAPTTLSVAGNWTHSAGAFTHNSGTVTFNGTTTQAINGSAASQTFYNVTLAKTAGQTLRPR